MKDHEPQDNVVMLYRQPSIPDTWDYTESVSRMQGLVYKWKNITADVAAELYVAREILKNQGMRTDLTSEQMHRGWGRYCHDIGIAKQTANRWLAMWYPSEKKQLPGGDARVIDVTGAASSLESLVGKGTKFGTIYADPPWPYSNQATRAATDNHYPTMTISDIAALPIKKLASDKAHLHLWTTNAFLFDCKSIMDEWGFEYKGVFVWIKPTMGIGNYWRVSHEFLLLGVRGGLTFLDHSQMSWIAEPRGKHSAKPESIRKLIEKVSPSPYLELFGRQTTEKWTVFGNELERTMFNSEILNECV